MPSLFPFHPGLVATTRFPMSLRDDESLSLREPVILLILGALTTTLLAISKGRWGLPGSHILFIFPPYLLGLALVPRRQSGSVLALSGVLAALILSFTGHGLGMGALTSTLIAGPILDITCARQSSKRHPYALFALAGLGTNLAAFLVRGSAKALLQAPGTTKSLAAWLPKALLSYPTLGALAGVVAASLFFQSCPKAKDPL